MRLISRRRTASGATPTPTPAPTPTPTPSPDPTFTQVLANSYRGASMSRSWAVGATQTSFKFRRPDRIMHRCDEIGLGFLNFLTNNGGEGTNGAAVNIQKLAIECNGVTVPVLIGGTRTTTIASGSTGAPTDRLASTAFGLPFFPADMPIFIRGWGTYAASVTGLTIDRDTYSGIQTGELYCQFAPGSSGEDDIDATGPMATPTGATLTPVFVPAAVLCRVEAEKVSIAISIDSVGAGYQDFVYDGGPASGGPFRRVQALCKKPLFLLGAYGMQMGGWGPKQSAVLATGWFTDFIGERKGNDITTGATLANLQARAQNQWTAATTAGLRKWETKTGYPNVPGNFLCTDTANQVKAPGCAVGGIGDQFNSWLETKVADGTIVGIVPLAAYDSANKVLVPGREYTLTAAVAIGATSIQVSGTAAPLVGDTLVIGPGTSAKIPFVVAAITGSGPWTCYSDAARFPAPNYLDAQTTSGTAAFASGVAVKASYIEGSNGRPETHLNPVMYGMLATAITALAPFA